MKIVAGNSIIIATPVMGETVAYNGQIVESVRLLMDQPLAQEQIQDLISNPWDEFDEADTLMVTVSGYNTVHMTSITILKVPDVVKENEELRAALAAMRAQLEQLQSQT